MVKITNVAIVTCPYIKYTPSAEILTLMVILNFAHFIVFWRCKKLGVTLATSL